MHTFKQISINFQRADNIDIGLVVFNYSISISFFQNFYRMAMYFLKSVAMDHETNVFLEKTSRIMNGGVVGRTVKIISYLR